MFPYSDISSLPRCLTLSLSEVLAVELNQLGPGQFKFSVVINGSDYTLLYDTGASCCFCRDGLSIQAEKAKLSCNSNNPNGGIQVRLGDNSLVSASECRHLVYDIKGRSHSWDYHTMPLPSGIDIIVGMDFMEANDVVLLTKQKKVLFGSHVLNFLLTEGSNCHILDFSNPGCKYGPREDVQPSDVLKNSPKPALKDASDNASETATEEGVSEDCMQQHEDT